MILLYKKVKRKKLVGRFKSFWNCAEWSNKYLKDVETKKYYIIITKDHKLKSDI